MTGRVAAFISKRWSVPRACFRVEMHSLRGGLESTVARARISQRSRQSSMPTQLVIKTLRSGQTREVEVYEALWRYLDMPPTIRVLGRDCHGPNTYLFLEHAERISNWPWSDTEHAAAVCRELARFHDCRVLPVERFLWDYERELSSSAVETLAIATDARDLSGRGYWRRPGDLKRVVAMLPRIRAQLLTSETTVLHGDVHPGNVISA
jgi:Phosphotransferase enzyme family